MIKSFHTLIFGKYSQKKFAKKNNIIIRHKRLFMFELE